MVDVPPRYRAYVRDIAMGSTAVLLVTLVLWRRPGGDSVARDVSNVVVARSGLTATVYLARRAGRARGRLRWSWGLITASALCWTAARTLWLIYETGLGQRPFPSPVDFLVASCAPLLIAGLILMPDLRGGRSGKALMAVDCLMIASGCLVMAWGWIIGDLWHAWHGSDLGLFLRMAPIAGITVAIAIGLFVVAHTWYFRDVALWPVVLLVMGLILWSITNAGATQAQIHGTFHTGHMLDLGWYIGFFFIFLAGRHPAHKYARKIVPRTEGRTTVATLIPYPATLLCLTVPVAELFSRAGPQRFPGALLILCLVLLAVRQIATLQLNLALTRGLEARVVVRTVELTRSESRFRALVSHSSDVVFVLDAQGVVTYASPAVREVFGLDPRALVGSPFIRLMLLGDSITLMRQLSATIESPYSSKTVSFKLRGGDGRWRQTETVLTSLLEDPAVGGLVLNTRDVTERKELEDQLTHQAFHDALTGLANRALFRNRVDHALASCVRRGRPLAVLFLDLDGFKGVNDAFGHNSGDELLIAIGKQLSTSVRIGDTVARLGGDEFAILLEEVRGKGHAEEIALRLMTALATPVEVGGRQIHPRASMGAAMVDPLSLHTMVPPTAGELLRNADLAMYRAKAARHGGLAWYEDDMHFSLLSRIEDEHDLSKALDRQEFLLHYQPTYDLHTGEILGVEALLRWQRPERGLVMPGDFIALAEEMGLIVSIGSWVVEEACRQAVAWERDHGTVLWMAVNVSGRQLQDSSFADFVLGALARTGLPPDRLVLELTESLVLDDNDQTSEILQRLREHGVRIAIDDFGTGYSSLSYLARFPVDVLKVDRSFVEGLSRKPGSSQDALARTIVQLGHSLGLTMVAEGIEDAVQHQILREMGCAMGQGYHFSRAVPAPTVSKMLVDEHQLLVS